MASDIYTPSLPAIAKYFNSSVNLSQFTLAIFMIGVAGSLFLYGPISDALGRKQPLITGIIIFIVGTFVCLASNNIYMLISGRFIQGVGAGAGAGLWRSIFKDSFNENQIAKYVSYFTLIVTAVIPLSPSVGGYLEHYFSWHASFVAMLVYALVTLSIVIFKFKESSAHHHMERLKPSFIAQSYKDLFSNKNYIGYTSTVFLTFGSLFFWMTISPILLIKYAHFSPVYYGWASSGVGLIGMGSGSFINNRLIDRVGPRILMQTGWFIIILSGIALYIIKYMLGVDAIAILITTTIAVMATMFVWPNAFAGAMQPFAHIAGYAGTTYSAIQLGGGAIFGALASHLPDHNQIPYATVLIISAVLSLIIFRICIPKK